MVLKDWFCRLFHGNRTEEGLLAARESGREDGRALTLAYAGGFMEGVSDVLGNQLRAFQTVETTAVKAIPEIESADPSKPLKTDATRPAKRLPAPRSKSR